MFKGLLGGGVCMRGYKLQFVYLGNVHTEREIEESLPPILGSSEGFCI